MNWISLQVDRFYQSHMRIVRLCELVYMCMRLYELVYVCELDSMNLPDTVRNTIAAKVNSLNSL